MLLISNIFSICRFEMPTIGRHHLLVWAFRQKVRRAGGSQGQLQLLFIWLQPQGICMEILVTHIFRVVLLNICDLFANIRKQLCTDASLEAKFKAENLVSNRSRKTFRCVHCVCRSLFFYIVIGEIPPDAVFPSKLVVSSPSVHFT